MFIKYELLSTKNNIVTHISSFICCIILFALLLNKNIVENDAWPTVILIVTVMVLHSVFFYIFRKDYENGIIEQIFLQPICISIFLIKKIVLQILLYQISIVCIIIALQLLVDIENFYQLIFSLLLTLPIIITFSALSGALSLSKNNSGITTFIIIFPLLIPTAILGNSLVYNVGRSQELILLISLLLTTIPINIVAIYYSLKIAIEHS